MKSAQTGLNHPCFNHSACKDLARIHLPVAPHCNIQCNFCNRLYDCVNETRPGITSKILSPEQACEKYLEIKEKIRNLSVVGFAGPGDPLANFEEIKKTTGLIKKHDKQVNFCLSTNGLMLAEHAEDIIKTGFSYITVTINAIDPGTAAGIYEYINYKGKIYRGESATGILIENQLQGLEFLSSRGVICKINTLYLKGINDFQIMDIAKLVSEKGAYIMNLKNLIPAKGSKFEKISVASAEEIGLARKKAAEYIKQMYHCQQCRADSVGLLSNDRFKEFY